MKKRLTSVIAFLFIIIVSTTTFASSLSINSPSAILIDSKTGDVLYEKGADTQRAVASTTKVMTYLLVMEAIDRGDISMNDVVTVSTKASNTGGSNYKLKAGERVSIRELIDSMIIISANDSAVVLAEHVSGSVSAFSKRMNQKALELGLQKAYFVNPNGLPEKNNIQNKATARDMAKITDYTLKKYELDLTERSKRHYFTGEYKSFSQKNTNKIVTMSYIVDGLKTGYTKLAGHCLISTYNHPTNPDHRIISVVLGSSTSDQRFDDSLKLIEYGIHDYKTNNLISRGDTVLKDIINFDGKRIPVELVAVSNLDKFSLKNTKFYNFIEDSLESNLSDLLSGKEAAVRVRLTDGTEGEVSLRATRGICVFLDDNQIDFKGVEPVVKGDRTLVPVRALTENMGFEVTWNEYEESVTLTKDGNLIEFIIGSRVVNRNGRLLELDTATELIGNTTYVPLRFIAESLSHEVEWIGENREVIIKCI